MVVFSAQASYLGETTDAEKVVFPLGFTKCACVHLQGSVELMKSSMSQGARIYCYITETTAGTILWVSRPMSTDVYWSAPVVVDLTVRTLCLALDVHVTSLRMRWVEHNLNSK